MKVTLDLRGKRRGIILYRNPNGEGVTLRVQRPEVDLRVIFDDEQLLQIAAKIGEQVSPNLILVKGVNDNADRANDGFEPHLRPAPLATVSPLRPAAERGDRPPTDLPGQGEPSPLDCQSERP